MNYNTFWVCIISLITVGILGIVLGTQSYYNNRNVLMAELIVNGSDPIEVMCAFDDVMGRNPTCVMKSMPE